MTRNRDAERRHGAPLQLESRQKRLAVVHPECLADLQFFVQTDARVAGKILTLMEQTLRDPFTGLGKPEPLKELGSDIWSRRVTQIDRLVYVVYDDRIEFLQGRYHY